MEPCTEIAQQIERQIDPLECSYWYDPPTAGTVPKIQVRLLASEWRKVIAALAEPAPNADPLSPAAIIAASEEAPSEAVELAHLWINMPDEASDRISIKGVKILAREVLRKAHPAVTPQEWRELGRLEGVAETIKSASEACVVSRNAVIDECAKVALAYTRAPGPDWTQMAPEWETKPEMYKIGYAYASGCSEQADDIYERIIALKDGSEYVNAREPDPFLIEVCDELFGGFLHQRSSLDDDFKYQCAHCERGMHVQNWWLAEHEPDCIINRVREFLVKHKPESVPEAHKYGSVSQDGQPK